MFLDAPLTVVPKFATPFTAATVVEPFTKVALARVTPVVVPSAFTASTLAIMSAEVSMVLPLMSWTVTTGWVANIAPLEAPTAGVVRSSW